MSNFIDIQEISRSYSDIKAVDNFSLSVSSGEIMALVGPDGAGKTTLMRALCNLIALDQGKITIDGLSVEKEFEQIKPMLGYMPQQFSLYPDLSVQENLEFYAGIFDVTGSAFEKRAEELYGFSNLKPFRKRRALDLSGGMKQKLALSCALMHDPKVLLLDEPTTGVDPLSRRQFWEILLNLKKAGVTILVSTPNMDEVARADRACFIFKGKKLTEGKPDELPNLFEGQLFYLDTEPTSSIVRELNSIKGLTARRFGAGMHLCLGQDDSIEAYSARLEKLALPKSQIRPIKPGLEDCFIQLMERQL
ncbi:MAG: ABC transporter ATP-binding protein [bacterium]|nr:ABC transporter ATP-binding protein [bacterium]